MQRYIELTLTGERNSGMWQTVCDGRKMTIRMDSIRTVEDAKGGGGCVINGYLKFKESYAELKGLIRNDQYRIVIDGEVDFRLKRIAELGLIDIAKRFPGGESVEFLKKLLACETESASWDCHLFKEQSNASAAAAG